MAGFPASERKRILSDPVGTLARHDPDAPDHRVSELQDLNREYIELGRHHRDIQQQSRSVSRKIGEAKRDGQPIDTLKAEMQALSTSLKESEAKLATTSDRILGYFVPAGHAGKTANPEKPVFGERAYRSGTAPAGPLDISLLDNETGEWNDYVAGNPAASIYHRAEWRPLISETFGHDCSYFLARDKDRSVVGILPLVRLKSRLFGDFFVSMPYFNYGGAVAEHPSVEIALMNAANDHASGLKTTHVEYRDDIPREGWPVRTEKVLMILPLPDTVEQLWDGFTPKLRAQIRRPQRENPQIVSGGIEYLDDFYRVFARNMRDLGTPVYGRNFFRRILETFPDAYRIIVVRLGNRPVAAGFLAGDGNTLEIPWASTIRDVNHMSINMLLYWESLKYATEHGYRFFDFGRCTRNAGTFRFKQQWGALPRQLYWHYWLDESRQIPSLNPGNPKFALAIYLWKKLPLALANRLGPPIVRNLP